MYGQNSKTEGWQAMTAETVFEDGQELEEMIEQWRGEGIAGKIGGREVLTSPLC